MSSQRRWHDEKGSYFTCGAGRRWCYRGLVDSFEQVEMTRAIGGNDLKAIKEVRALIKNITLILSMLIPAKLERLLVLQILV